MTKNIAATRDAALAITGKPEGAAAVEGADLGARVGTTLIGLCGVPIAPRRESLSVFLLGAADELYAE
jgi:hypothetical protein